MLIQIALCTLFSVDVLAVAVSVAQAYWYVRLLGGCDKNVISLTIHSCPGMEYIKTGHTMHCSLGAPWTLSHPS